jgi:uncharacterized protein (TIGR03435 family)
MKHTLLDAARVAVIAESIVAGVLNVPLLRARSSAAQAGSPAFEVASVKPNRSREVKQEFSVTANGSFRLTNATVRMLIRMAYRVQDFQILAPPSWTDIDRFDVTARAPGGTTTAAVPQMLRALLQDRFALLAHADMRDMPIYALVVSSRDAALGPRIRRTPSGASAECAAQRANREAPGRSDGRPCGISIAGGTITAGDATFGQLLGLLSPLVGRVAVDKTKLDGTFDYNLSWTLDQFVATGTFGVPSERAIDSNGPSIFTAVQEQLGLKLESTKGPVDVLVIDHVEQPTPD